MSEKHTAPPQTPADAAQPLPEGQSSRSSPVPGSQYKVDRIEVVMRTAEVLARVFNLVPGDRIPWHVHRLSSDHYFVLSGTLTIETEQPTQLTVLSTGEHWRVDPGTEHEVSNRGTVPVSFLLLQGTGGYDWIKVER